MELEFRESTQNCLKRAVWGVKNEEQTLEIKLPDAMPDIGSVLGARGQTLLRGKEWRGSSVQINGGVLVWVLYAPEDGSAPKTVEGWLPISLRWELPENDRDGNILADLQLESIDSRSVSARKLLVRATVSGSIEALTAEKMKFSRPGELPADVQLLRKTYPVQLTLEAGERVFEMEEQLPLPSHCAQAEKILYSALQPRISECKLLGDKLVFRGVAQVRLLFRTADERLTACDLSLPFSQYAQLEQAYDEGAAAYVLPAVTALETELEGDLRLKIGLVGQYSVSAPVEVELIADAYSTCRSLELQTDEVHFPTLLDRRSYTVDSEMKLADGICDLFLTAGHPRPGRTAEGVELTVPGTVQYLTVDPEGQLQGHQHSWEGQTAIQADRAAQLHCAGMQLQYAQKNGAALEVLADMASYRGEGIPAVVGLTPGEAKSDARRPSLILCRKETDSLWETAKACCSTVEAILAANGLEQEPEEGTLLLIPVV